MAHFMFAMAPSSRLQAVALLLVLLLTASAIEAAAANRTRRQYARVFGFGDSLTDTGNSAIFPLTAGGPFAQLPYGETWPARPSGRASDGRLIIDFLVEKLRVPEPTPYLAGRTTADFVNGSNFAMGSATALEPAFLARKGVMSAVPISLANETRWFKNVLQLLHASGHGEPCEITASSIFYLGEIGVNDYFVALTNHTADLAASLVPDVIGAIRSALEAMIAAGARTAIVDGMIAIGCEPEMLALNPGGPGDYDPATGCIARFNAVAELHNVALKRMLNELRHAHPRLSLLYVDLYGPVIRLVSSSARLGGKPLAACCGGGGNPYNFNFSFFCGTPAATACPDPSKSVSWDGIHYTQATYKFMARPLLRSHHL